MSTSTRFQVSAGMGDPHFGMQGTSNRTTVFSHLLSSRCWGEAARRAASHPHEVSSGILVCALTQVDAPPHVLKAILEANPRSATDAFTHVVANLKDEHRFQGNNRGSETQKQQATNLIQLMKTNEGTANDDSIVQAAKDIGDRQVYMTRVAQVGDCTIQDENGRPGACPFMYALQHLCSNQKILASVAPTPGFEFFIQNWWDAAIAGMELNGMLGGRKGTKNTHEEAILKSLEQHPGAAAYSGRNECLLNKAICRQASEEVILELLKSCPHSAFIQKDKMFPVHLAIKNGYSTQVIAALARVNPSALLVGIKMDYRLVGDVKMPFYQYMWNRHCGDSSSLPNNLKNQNHRKFWEIISCSLVISHYGNIPEDFPQRPFAEILHASLEATRHGGHANEASPCEMFRQAWRLFRRHWGNRKDRNGDLPLQAMMRKPFVSSDEIAGLKYILEEFDGTAAQVNDDGSTPLVLALQSCRTWDEGVGCIYEAAKQTVTMRDPKTGLYPFMVAASSSWGADEGDSDKQVDVTYRLLRAHPGCMEQFVQGMAAQDDRTSRESTIQKRLEVLENERLELERELALLKETQSPAAKRQRQE